MTVVRRDARPATTADAGKCSGDHQVDRNTLGREPAARLRVNEISMESGPCHRLVEQRLVAEGTRVDGEVAVLR
jgi:hypothetical protein